MNRFRIRKRDKHNWVIERWQEGGEAITRGRYVGQEKQSKWDTINPVGYYPTLANAASRLLDEELAAEWPADGWTGEDVSAAILAAEERVLATLAESEEEPTEEAEEDEE